MAQPCPVLEGKPCPSGFELPPDAVTTRELHQHISEIVGRISRLEKFMILIAAAVASPKIGGPDPTKVVAATIGLLT